MKAKMKTLKSLNYKIKSKNLSVRQNGFKELKSLKIEGDASLQMYAKYLEGKYYYLTAKTTSPLKNYANAHYCFRKVFDIARNHRKYVKNPKYHFKYAESAYQLSKWVWGEHQQEEYDSLAFSIESNAKMLFPSNNSIKWLMSELTK